jgi:hypothetical protein
MRPSKAIWASFLFFSTWTLNLAPSNFSPPIWSRAIEVSSVVTMLEPLNVAF